MQDQTKIVVTWFSSGQNFRQVICHDGPMPVEKETRDHLGVSAWVPAPMSRPRALFAQVIRRVMQQPDLPVRLGLNTFIDLGTI